MTDWHRSSLRRCMSACCLLLVVATKLKARDDESWHANCNKAWRPAVVECFQRVIFSLLLGCGFLLIDFLCFIIIIIVVVIAVCSIAAATQQPASIERGCPFESSRLSVLVTQLLACVCIFSCSYVIAHPPAGTCTHYVDIVYMLVCACVCESMCS